MENDRRPMLVLKQKEDIFRERLRDENDIVSAKKHFIYFT